MWRLLKGKNKKFDIAFVSKNGRLIVRSSQGYNRRGSAINEILEMDGTVFQDETNDVPVRYYMKGFNDGWSKDELKPFKVYKPKTKKRA